MSEDNAVFNWAATQPLDPCSTTDLCGQLLEATFTIRDQRQRAASGGRRRSRSPGSVVTPASCAICKRRTPARRLPESIVGGNRLPCAFAISAVNGQISLAGALDETSTTSQLLADNRRAIYSVTGGHHPSPASTAAGRRAAFSIAENSVLSTGVGAVAATTRTPARRSPGR
jgi:hypothetical protein